jgi:hypothetical protein
MAAPGHHLPGRRTHEVVNGALDLSTTALILVHNHVNQKNWLYRNTLHRLAVSRW